MERHRPPNQEQSLLSGFPLSSSLVIVAAKLNSHFPGHLSQNGVSRNCTELLQEKKEMKEMEVSI